MNKLCSERDTDDQTSNHVIRAATGDDFDDLRALFPDGDICASLLPPDAHDVIGRVGDQTRGAEKLLRRVGFNYINRVDPFDGGPHFLCATDPAAPVVDSRCCSLAPGRVPTTAPRYPVAALDDLPPYFTGVLSPVAAGQESALLPPAALNRLRVTPSCATWLLPA